MLCDSQIWVSHSLIAVKDYEVELTAGKQEKRTKFKRIAEGVASIHLDRYYKEHYTLTCKK